MTSFDGTSLCVRAAGDPSLPTLVFAHGFSLDMTTWHYQWTGLADRYRCVLLDFRGHGRSGRPSGNDYGLASMAGDLAAVLEAVSPHRPVVLAGHSMGASAILALAEARPDLFGPVVVGAAFVGASAYGFVQRFLGSMSSRMQGVLTPRLPSAIGVARRIDSVRRVVSERGPDLGHLVARLTNFGPNAPPHVVDHVAGLAAGAPIRVWTDGLAGLIDLDLRAAAARVTVPSLVVVGEHDRVTPPRAAEALAALLPDARPEWIGDAGHQAMLEQPERFNELLAGFASDAFAKSPTKRKRKRKPT